MITLYLFEILKFGDEDPDSVGSVDFWPVGSGFGTFFHVTTNL